MGPHTLSLVTEADIPQINKERKLCFTSGHIAKRSGWHGVKGKGPPTKNPAKAGKTGWDAVGSLKKKGDSWFTGNEAERHLLGAGLRRHLERPADDHLHVRRPFVDARLDRSPASDRGLRRRAAPQIQLA